MNTILLDPLSWDLVVDAFGNIAMASDPYSVAQDAASAIRTFQGEVYYNTNLGVPYWQEILGYAPPLALMKLKFVDAALTVPGAENVRCFISSVTDRHVQGQVQILDNLNRVRAASNFGPPTVTSLPTPPPLNYKDNEGFLIITASGWPTTSVGRPVGGLWNDGGFARVAGDTTPDPLARPVYFGSVTAGQLLVLGGTNLPVDNPGPGTGAFWNNGGFVCIANRNLTRAGSERLRRSCAAGDGLSLRAVAWWTDTVLPRPAAVGGIGQPAYVDS